MGCLGATGDQRIYVDLTLGEVKVRAMVDTGASQSQLRKDVLDRIQETTGRALVLAPVESLVSLTEHQVKLRF